MNNYKLVGQSGGDRIVELWKKYGKDIVKKMNKDRTAPKYKIESLPNNFIDADPTHSKYIEWIITSYLNDGISMYEDLLSRVLPSLEDYLYLLKRKYIQKNPLEPSYNDPTNIMNYCGLNGCKMKVKGKLFDKPGLTSLIDQYES
jgi:hypothetical protein